MPIPIAAVLGAGIAGNLADTLLRRKGVKDQNAENRYLADQQYKRSIANWNRQNAYNHPMNQMARLKQAGLNPRLMYGSSAHTAAGNASDVGNYDRAETKSVNEGFNAFSNTIQMGNLAAQTNNVKAQTQLNDAKTITEVQQAALTAMKTKGQGIDNRLAAATFNNSVEASRVLLDQNIQKLAQDRINTSILQGTKQQQIDKVGQELRRITALATDAEKMLAVSELQRQLAKKNMTINDPIWTRQLSKHSKSIIQQIIRKIFKGNLSPQFGPTLKD